MLGILDFKVRLCSNVIPYHSQISAGLHLLHHLNYYNYHLASAKN